MGERPKRKSTTKTTKNYKRQIYRERKLCYDLCFFCEVSCNISNLSANSENKVITRLLRADKKLRYSTGGSGSGRRRAEEVTGVLLGKMYKDRSLMSLDGEWRYLCDKV